MKQLVLYILFCLFLFGLEAQDWQLSQNYAFLPSVNPAQTGLTQGDLRVNAIYRQQWTTIDNENPFRTIGVSADTKLVKGFRKQDWINVGIQLLSDQAGSSNWGQKTVHLSAAYALTLGYYKNHYLSAGLNLGFINEGFDLGSATFSNQYGEGAYDPNASSGENFDNSSVFIPDAGAGITYYYMKNARKYYFGGLSAQHVYPAKYSYLSGSDQQLNMRIQLQAGACFQINNRMDVLPSVFVSQQSGGFKADIGGFYRLVFDEGRRQEYFKAFSLGVFAKINHPETKTVGMDAITTVLKLDYDSFGASISYDFNVSSFNVATYNRGAAEISAYYILRIRENKFYQESATPRF